MSITFSVCHKCNSVNKVNLSHAKEKSPLCGKCGSSLPLSGAVNEVTDQSFSNLLQKSDLPIVLDLWAPWCGPCRSFAPSFSKAAEDFAGSVVFAKLNTDQNPALPQSLGIRGIPTLIVFKNGQEVNRISGALPADQFGLWLKQNIQ